MTKRCLPLVSLPKVTVPVISAMMAGSLGLRASNRSATRGRPPVMSRVLEDSCGMRANTSPTATWSPSVMDTTAPAGRKYWAGISVPGIFKSLSSSSYRRKAGRKSLPAEPRCLGSVITNEDRPVTSSVWLLTEIPSAKSRKRILPATSVMMGWVWGSQLATVAPPSTLLSS